MNGTDLPNELWHKSTYSNGQAACVEVAEIGGHVTTRDSKNPSGPALVFTTDAWTAFVASVRAGELHHP